MPPRPYGALVAGPDHNDVFVCGKESRPYLLLPDGKSRDFFYKFPNRAEPVRKTGYIFDPADKPVQDVMDSQFNEVALDYNAGFTASLAWLCAHDLRAGKALPESAFPPRSAARGAGENRRGHRSQHARAHALPTLNCIVTAEENATPSGSRSPSCGTTRARSGENGGEG